MLQAIAPNIWHLEHAFTVAGMGVSSRMTVVRLTNNKLWLHSPVPLSAQVRAQMAALGEVAFVVAPNKYHHLFAAECMAAFPQARLYGAPGLPAKRPDLKGMQELKPAIEPEWQQDLEQIFFAGVPIGNETVWYHKQSRTLILTDICQWWQGDLPLPAKLFGSLAGVRKQLAVPRIIRLMTKDRHAAQASARKILQWPFERVVVAHNCILEAGAHAAVERAFDWFE
jgi:hypothetical protein